MMASQGRAGIQSIYKLFSLAGGIFVIHSWHVALESGSFE